MRYIQCCSGLRECRTYELVPDDFYIYKELRYLEECPVCHHTTLYLFRLDKCNNVSTYKLKNQKAKKFFKKCEKDIVREKIEYVFNNHSAKSSFYLYYNEFGTKKKCYSNLSYLNIGRIG
ncbi:hypothetical protein IJG72_01020 [bacterium]|nr:hypothetical protein [bacterium]